MKKDFLLLLMLAVTSTFMLLSGCASEDILNTTGKTLDLPEQPYNYTAAFPDEFINKLMNSGGVDFLLNSSDPIFSSSQQKVFNFQGINVTDEGATLGRVLFYDTQLSINNSVACASCHKQTDAFADKGLAGSIGFGGKKTPRNSMAICNVGFNNNLFWDSRTQSIRDLIMQPIQNHIEMGMEVPDKLITKLAQLPYYPALFEQAYGDPTVTIERISDATSQFLISMVSCNAKFDQAEKVGFTNFSPLEKMGHSLFFSDKAKCSQCHSGANFSAPDGMNSAYGAPTVKGTANIGLALNYKDNGKGQGHFKIPSLRNIAQTAPYMHDGSLKTLEDVVEHYNSGIQAHNELDARLRENGNTQRLNLSNLEKQALVAFLHTLTDESLTKDVRFSDPFTK